MTAVKGSFPARVLAALFVLVLLGGCTTTNPFSSSMTTSEMAPEEIPAMTNSVGDFDDIELPYDMKWLSDESMAIKTESFEGGVLTYKGRVEIASLKNYLISAMENKKWKLAGEVNSESILLAFTKPAKTCMVVLEEGIGGKYGYTRATFYVTVDIAAAGRLNPFGEPVH